MDIIKNLSEKHLSNARLIPNRLTLISLLPTNGIVAEIGVDEGIFSEEILRISKPEKFILIDHWARTQSSKKKMNAVKHKFRIELGNNQIEILHHDSVIAAQFFKDNYFDWIYLDTGHSYKTTKEELHAYASKIKENGIIAGHDYNSGSWKSLVKYGVIEAVNEFCIDYNWELIFLTIETNAHRSFALRKIKE